MVHAYNSTLGRLRQVDPYESSRPTWAIKALSQKWKGKNEVNRRLSSLELVEQQGILDGKGFAFLLCICVHMHVL